MNKLLSILFLLTIAFPTLSFAQSRCLQQASDDDLLDELSRRLGNSTGPIDDEISEATYTCNGQYFYISLVSPTGSEARSSVYVTSSTYCSELRSTLSTTKWQISNPTTIALCNGQYLYRKQLTPSGSINDLNTQYLSSSSECVDTANEINRRN